VSRYLGDVRRIAPARAPSVFERKAVRKGAPRLVELEQLRSRVTLAHAETEADRLESVEAARRQLVESFAGVRDRADRIGVPLEHVVIEGDHPAEDLLSYAHEHGFDLVVAGHHRGGRAGRFLLHGLAERLVDTSSVPVLVVGDENGA
jgi:nucleotide-binding universal stress UspA family protein